MAQKLTIYVNEDLFNFIFIVDHHTSGITLGLFFFHCKDINDKI